MVVGTPALALMPCRAGRHFPIPIEEDVLHREAYSAVDAGTSPFKVGRSDMEPSSSEPPCSLKADLTSYAPIHSPAVSNAEQDHGPNARTGHSSAYVAP